MEDLPANPDTTLSVIELKLLRHRIRENFAKWALAVREEEDPLEILDATPFKHVGLTNLYYDLKCPFMCERDMVVDPVVLECGHVYCDSCIKKNIALVNYFFYLLFYLLFYLFIYLLLFSF